MNEESLWKAVHRMEEAADKSQRAAETMEQAAARIAHLFEFGYGGNGLRLIELLESTHQAPAECKDEAVEIDARCFRFWVREAACAPGALAKAISNCITEQDYRDVLIPMMQAADDAIEKARRAA